MNISFEESLKISQVTKVEDVAPNFRKKNNISNEHLEKIVQTIGINLEISTERVLAGMFCLFLQGASSAGAPLTMSVDLGNGKCMEKRNIVNACVAIVGHPFIRRIAETLAYEIGTFAFNNKLYGELANRINNKLKAESGENLTELEMAFCSSFSQSIVNLAEVTSERLSRKLTEDYLNRFENKKKSIKTDNVMSTNKTNKKKKNNKKK